MTDTPILEVSVTDVLPESPPTQGEPVKDMRFVGLSKEETPRFVTFQVPRKEGEIILKALVTGQEPVSFLRPQDIVLIQNFVQLQTPSPLAAMVSKPIDLGAQSSTLRAQAEMAAMNSIERLAAAKNELDAAREEGNDVFKQAQAFRALELEVNGNIGKLVSVIAEEMK